VIGSFTTGFDIHQIAASNDLIFTSTKCGITEVWLKERITKFSSIKMGGGGNAKITSLTTDADGDMLFAGSSEGKIRVRAQIQLILTLCLKLKFFSWKEITTHVLAGKK